MKGRAHLVDVGAVAADCLVQCVAGDAEFFSPVGDVGRQLGIDDLGIVWPLGFFFVDWVRGVLFGCLAVILGQLDPLSRSVVRWMNIWTTGMSFAGITRKLRAPRVSSANLKTRASPPSATSGCA